MSKRSIIWFVLILGVIGTGAIALWPREEAERFGGPKITVRGVDWIAGNYIRTEVDGNWRLQADMAFAGSVGNFELDDPYLQATCGMMLYELSRETGAPLTRKDVYRVDLNYVSADSTLDDIKLAFERHIPIPVVDGKCLGPQQDDQFFPVFGERLPDWYLFSLNEDVEETIPVLVAEFHKPFESTAQVSDFDYQFACQSLLRDPIVTDFDLPSIISMRSVAEAKTIKVVAKNGKPSGFLRFWMAFSETFDVVNGLCVPAGEGLDG